MLTRGDISADDDLANWKAENPDTKDIKFAIRNGNDSSARSITDEFLRAEKMIAAGIVEPHQPDIDPE